MVIKRELFDQIKKHLEDEEIILIVGPRQVGKTTLMKGLEEDLKSRGEKTLFLNLDLDTDRPAFESQSKLLQRITYNVGKEKGYVFIDEIQRKENAGLFLKGIYDMKLPYKFIVSGSGSIELKEKIHESLAGRKRLFEMTPVTFEEFVEFKQGQRIGEMATFFDVFKEQAEQLLNEYLNFGGYPKVILAETIEEKLAVITDIYQSYVEKDISILLNVQKTDSFTNLVKILSSQIGNLVNVAELSATLGLSVQTIKEYLWYLEKTYIIHKVSPYFTNIRKEITKAPTYYFVDLGLRNYAIDQFGIASSRSEGFLFQNFVFNALKSQIKTSPATIHFWRTKDGAEVDFVLSVGLKNIPVEVKHSRLDSTEVSRSFRSFLTKYNPDRAYIIHSGSDSLVGEFEGTKIYFVPFFNIQSIIDKELNF